MHPLVSGGLRPVVLGKWCRLFFVLDYKARNRSKFSGAAWIWGRGALLTSGADQIPEQQLVTPHPPRRCFFLFFRLPLVCSSRLRGCKMDWTPAISPSCPTPRQAQTDLPCVYRLQISTTVHSPHDLRKCHGHLAFSRAPWVPVCRNSV